jgi:hypothetical protein
VQRLYACLGEGAVSFLSGVRWPRPGEPNGWLRAGLDAPPHAVRGVPLETLPWWLDEELWEVELDGARTPGERCVLAERARLVARVAEWTPQVAAELVDACARRAAATPYAADVRHYAADAATPAAGAAVAAYVAAHALAGGDATVRTYADRFDEERRWQVEWLKGRLRL